MPEISRFFGIIIKMYFDEHPPPHVHAEYAERLRRRQCASRRLRAIPAPAEPSSGQEIPMRPQIPLDMPPRALGLVVEWASQYQQQLLDRWSRAADHQALYRIPPLR